MGKFQEVPGDGFYKNQNSCGNHGELRTEGYTGPPGAPEEPQATSLGGTSWVPVRTELTWKGPAGFCPSRQEAKPYRLQPGTA